MVYHLGSSMHSAFQGFGDTDVASLGIPTEKHYLDMYMQRTGRQSISNWHFYLAFAMFRGAAILQGVYKRAKQGNASSPKALIVGAMATVVAQSAWNLVAATQDSQCNAAAAASLVSSTLFDCSNAAFAYAKSLGISARAADLHAQVLDFIKTKVLPVEHQIEAQINAARPKWVVPSTIESLKQEAKVLTRPVCSRSLSLSLCYSLFLL
jgi:hypothetical protein